MHDQQIKAIFDQQAAGYDERWARTAPIRDALHFLLEAVFAGLPSDARVLCVGAGTGEEMAYLARRFPRWTFTAVEPSGAMLEVCRRKAEREGFSDRCRLHEGYLASLPAQAPFDAATCLLVSQFILDPPQRSALFGAIGERLRPGGILASADLAADIHSPSYDTQLALWMHLMAAGGIATAGLEQMRAAYARDVAILPPAEVAALIAAAGFDTPLVFHQAGLIHAWSCRRMAG